MEVEFMKTFPDTKCCFCSMEIPEGEGIMLQACLHSYCRRCLSSSVEQQILSGANKVKCIYADDDDEEEDTSKSTSECTGIVMDVEIKEVAIDSIFARYTNRELYEAQNQLNQLQKCLNATCNNFIWIENPETEDSFLCPHCNTHSCLKCKVNYGRDKETKFCNCAGKRPLPTSEEAKLYKKRKMNDDEDDKTIDYEPDEWDIIWDQLCNNHVPTTSTNKNMSTPSDKKGIWVTETEFECPICLDDVSVGDGVMLSECFHSFHRECLAKTIECSESIQVKCPYVKLSHSCQSLILDREIKAVVSSEVHEKHLKKSIEAAELKCKNRVHCYTIDCNGWCEVEGRKTNLEYFMCPVCSKKNCISCEAIHENVSCEEYKLKLNLWNLDDKSKVAMETLMKKKKARTCPQCGVLIIKNGGCNHMHCTICNKDFNWVPEKQPVAAGNRQIRGQRRIAYRARRY